MGRRANRSMRGGVSGPLHGGPPLPGKLTKWDLFRGERLTQGAPIQAYSMRHRVPMPQGSKAKYSAKQKRQAEHIEESCEKKGASKKTAAKRAWQTVNKQTGGGEKSGGGKKTPAKAKKSARKDSAKRAATSRKSGARKGQKAPSKRAYSARSKSK
jgi:hypothetical protein